MEIIAGSVEVGGSGRRARDVGRVVKGRHRMGRCLMVVMGVVVVDVMGRAEG